MIFSNDYKGIIKVKLCKGIINIINFIILSMNKN